MERWRQEKLGQVCDFINRGISPKYLNEGGIRVLNQRCIRDHRISFENARRHDGTVKAVSADRFIRRGDVLVNSTGTGTLGRVAQVREAPSEPTTVDSHVTIVRPKPGKFFPDFFGYMLVKIEEAIKEAGEGCGGQTELSRSTLAEKFSVEYPISVAAQKRIVAILDEAFEGIVKAIANTEKNLANARELFKSYSEVVLGAKGSGWSETTLGAVAEFKNGLNFTRSSKGEKVRIVGVADFQNNLWVPTDELDVAQIDGSLSETYMLREGDILTVRSNGNKQLIGRCLLAGPVSKRTSHSGFTIRIRLSSDVMSPQFLVRQLKSHRTRQRLVASGDGANISSLNQRALTSLPISFPSLKAQHRIVAELDKLDAQASKLIEVIERKLAALSELKNSILQRAFIGQLAAATKDALDEAAE